MEKRTDLEASASHSSDSNPSASNPSASNSSASESFSYGGVGLTFRRANFNDLPTIMSINDNVYDGSDYLPAMFYVFMHSKEHELYILEEDGKAIGFMNYCLHSDDESLSTAMSGRVVRSSQNKGYFNAMHVAFAKSNKKLTHIYGGTLLKPKIQKNLHQWKVCYISHYFGYKICDRLRLQRFVRLRSNARPSSEPLRCSFSAGLKWLHASDRLTRFLTGYSPDFIPMEPSWNATRVSHSGLRRVFALCNCFVTFAEQTVGSGSTAADCIDRPTIAGFSYSSPLQCKMGVMVEVFFYGDDCDVLIDHFAAHLRHYATVTSDDVTLFCSLHFPLTIDDAVAEQRLMDEVGTRFQSDQQTVTKAVHYIFPIPQPKL